MGAGERAYALAEARQQTRAVEDASPTLFVPHGSTADVFWLPDDTSRDYLGNEFLLWLWYQLEAESDTLALADGSEVTALLARSLVLVMEAS